MNLDDRQLERLLRMAAKIDDAEASFVPKAGSRAALDTVGEGRMRLGFWKGAALAAACLCVIGLGIMLLKTQRTPVQNGAAGPVNIASTFAPLPKPSVPADVEVTRSAAAHDSVVLAIIADDKGFLRCVGWKSLGTSDGRMLSNLDQDELHELGMGLVCSAEQASSVLLVGLEGPTDEMPRNDASAAKVAQCILDSPRGNLPQMPTEICSPGTCVPTSVVMRMKTVALNK